MSYENLKTLKSLRKPLNKLKKELRHKEDELKVYSREINKERKPGQKNQPKDQNIIGFENEISSLKEKLKSERLKISESAKSGKIPEQIVFKGKDDIFYLKKRNKGNLRFRPILDESQVWDSARNTIDNILSLNEDDMANQILGMLQRGSSGENFLIPRVLLIEDEVLYKNNILVSDPRKNIRAYATRVGRVIEMENYLKGKGWDGKSNKMEFLAKGIRNDYMSLEDSLRAKYSKKREGITDSSKLDKIEKQEQKSNLRLEKSLRSDLRLCEDTYRRITGGYQVPDSQRAWIKTARFFANWGYATQLGALLLVSLQDAVSGVFRYGPKSLINNGVLPFVKNVLKFKNIDNVRLAEQAADMSLGLETYSAFVKFRFGNSTDYELPMNFIERQAENVASAMGIANFVNFFSDAVSKVNTTASMSSIIRNCNKFVDGTLSKNAEKELAVLGLNDKRVAGLIKKYFDKHGETLSGGYLANAEKWSLSQDLAEAQEGMLARDFLYGAVRQQTRSTVFRGKDIASYPTGLNPNGISQAFTMYMGYMFNATANYTIPLFQRFDPNKIMGTAAMISVSMLTNPLRKISRGEDPDLDPARLLWGGVLNSSVGGTLVDVFNRANAIGDIFPSAVIDRYDGKGLSLIGGMPAAAAETVFNLAGQAANNEWNRNDLKKAKRLIPLVEALQFRKFTNEWIESLDLPKTRAKAKKSREK